MALVTKSYTFSSGGTIVASEHNSNFDTLYSLVNGNITNTNIDASAAIADTKLAQITASDKVHFSSLVADSEAEGDLVYFNGTNWVRSTRADLGLSPAGVVAPYAGSSAPTGWLLCDGSAVSRTTYSALFTIVSTTYGVGDGSTTFNLPDMRGHIPLGKDDMGGSSANRVTDTEADNLGQSSGSEDVTLTTTELPAHTHSTPAHTHNINVEGAQSGSNRGIDVNSIVENKATAEADLVTGATPGTAEGGGTSGSAGSGSAFSIMNPYLTLNYIIKT